MNVHEPVSLAYVWIFLIAAVILVSLLVYLSPRLMAFLDKLADQRRQGRISQTRKEKADQENKNNDQRPAKKNG